MGIGRNAIVWSIAGLAVSLPIPFINAGQMVILYQTIPEEIQGRIFAVRNAITFCLRKLVSEGAGSGMAVIIGINRVFYDSTPKPAGTSEFE